MCSRFFISLAAAAIAVGLGVAAPAFPADTQVAEVPAPTDSKSITSTTEAVSIGYITPAYGAMSLSAPTTLSSGIANAGQVYGFSSSYVARGYGASFGLFGEFTGRQAILAYAPAQAWNFGASVGYAGFYLRGAVSDAPQLSPLFRGQGWQAGFGYEMGALDVRLMMNSQSGSILGVTDQAPNSQQWTLGGIYQISARFRLNADAFYGVRDVHGLYFSTPAATVQTQPPQGTGARVGIQLRF